MLRQKQTEPVTLSTLNTPGVDSVSQCEIFKHYLLLSVQNPKADFTTTLTSCLHRTHQLTCFPMRPVWIKMDLLCF